MTTHTPGPWYRDGSIIGPDTDEIDIRCDDVNSITVKGPNCEANARAILMAAAGSQLEALKVQI